MKRCRNGAESCTDGSFLSPRGWWSKNPGVTKVGGVELNVLFVPSQQPVGPSCGGVAVQQPSWPLSAGGILLRGRGARWVPSLRQGSRLGTGEVWPGCWSAQPAARALQLKKLGGVRTEASLCIFLPRFSEGNMHFYIWQI